MNTKSTSDRMSTIASKVLKNPQASQIQKMLAGSVLSQANKGNQTGSKMEDIASKVLKSNKYNDLTKSLAGSVLSQANKKR